MKNAHQPHVWWGYHRQHGWVVFDRSWPGNKYGRDGMIALVQCADWRVFEDSYRAWQEAILGQSSDYQYAPEYIERLPTYDERRLAENHLRHLQQEYERRHDTLRKQLTEQRRVRFLRELGIKADPPLRRVPRVPRTATCWRCSRDLDNAVDPECGQCEWIVCPNCGACGCGYGYSGYRAFGNWEL
ncbi:MAG: hypothetical protein NZ578_01195 [Candidatus Binatia bacterium]|nr:hypothetical protein [Candidatus Binatia bacterium]